MSAAPPEPYWRASVVAPGGVGRARRHHLRGEHGQRRARHRVRVRSVAAQTTSWIAVLYELPSVLSLILIYWYRRQLFIAWNIPGVAFLASQAGHLTFAEIIGASMAACQS